MATSNNLGMYLPTREDYISVKRDISDNLAILDAAAGNMDILVNGNTASVNVTSGQFVTVLNSTITGVTDGIYKAVANVAAGVPFVAANLSAPTSGALNELVDQIATLSPEIGAARVVTTGTIVANGDITYTVNEILSAASVSLSKMITIFTEGMRPLTSWDEVRPYEFYDQNTNRWGFHNIGTGGLFECTFIVVYKLY